MGLTKSSEVIGQKNRCGINHVCGTNNHHARSFDLLRRKFVPIVRAGKEMFGEAARGALPDDSDTGDTAMARGIIVRDREKSEKSREC
jgi:hypothetical protein